MPSCVRSKHHNLFRTLQRKKLQTMSDCAGSLGDSLNSVFTAGSTIHLGDLRAFPKNDASRMGGLHEPTNKTDIQTG